MVASSNSPHRRILRAFLGFLGASLFFAASGWAQTGSFSGDVKDENGKGLQGALVKIERTDIKGNYKVKTDKKGHYFHAGLPLGQYNIILEVEGKDIDRVNGVRTRLGDEVPINFNMAETKAKQVALQKSADTGQFSKEQERGMSAEQKAALEKQTKERSAQMAKNKELNDAFNAGHEGLTQAQQSKAQLAREVDATKKQELQATLRAQTTTAITKFDAAEKAIDASDPKQAQNVIVVESNKAEAYGLLAEVLTGQEQQDAIAKAIEAYSRAIALKPDDAAMHNNYALILARAKKMDDAKAELTKAAQLEPGQAGKYYYNLGALLVNTGLSAEAIDFFKKAIEADPNYAPAQYQYGNALSAKMVSQPDGTVVAPPEMKEALEKYLQLDPNGRDAEAAKGLLLAIGGKLETKYENPAAAKKKTKK